MTIHKNILIIMATIVLLIIVSLSAIIYQRSTTTTKINSKDYYGTYYLETDQSIDRKTVAICSPVNQEETDKMKGEFQIYNSSKILEKGVYQYNNKGYLSLYLDQKLFATMFISGENYVLVYAELEPVSMRKVDTIAVVFGP